MKLRTLASYLRNCIIMVIKSALLCTAGISCSISRGPWVEWGLPTLWPLHCLRGRFYTEKEWMLQGCKKILVKLMSTGHEKQLLASYDLYFSQLAIVSDQTKRSSNFQLKNTSWRILLFNNMHCSVTQNGELAFWPINLFFFYLKEQNPLEMKRSNTRFSAQPEIKQVSYTEILFTQQKHSCNTNIKEKVNIIPRLGT